MLDHPRVRFVGRLRPCREASDSRQSSPNVTACSKREMLMLSSLVVFVCGGIYHGCSLASASTNGQRSERRFSFVTQAEPKRRWHGSVVVVKEEKVVHLFALSLWEILLKWLLHFFFGFSQWWCSSVEEENNCACIVSAGLLAVVDDRMHRRMCKI